MAREFARKMLARRLAKLSKAAIPSSTSQPARAVRGRLAA